MDMDDRFRHRLEQVYAAHPINADAVLDRVRRARGTLNGLRARDLAEAAQGGVTDQNHPGGAAAVRALAAAAGIQRGWTVLDIGTGLGGSPRLLAEEFGCRCHGVELTASRFRDAVRLTHLVGLDDVVTFSHGDFMHVDVPGGPYDCAIAQGALMHFADLPAALDRIAGQLRFGGRLVVEDSVILTPPSTPEEADALAVLLRNWNGELQRRDAWPHVLDPAGFRLDSIENLTSIATQEFEDLLAAAASNHWQGVTIDERRGWELGLQLSRSGHLGAVRILATTKSPLPGLGLGMET
jgi:protein-L-isoaspartate O-methyltransferase